MWPFDWFSKKEYCDNCKTQLTLEDEDRHPLPLCNISKMAPMPAVTPCKQEAIDGISEPILSFVELFKKNPKRFKVYPDPSLPCSNVYKVVDLVISFECQVYDGMSWWFSYGDKLDWVTHEEWSYIHKNLKSILSERKEKLLSFQRNKYMKLYGPKEI